MPQREIVFGHSPDADDAFMFYALAKGHVTIPGYEIGHHMVDIESLNKLADIGEIPVTAISAAHYPAVADKYRIMSCGASVGRNYGPVVVSKKPMREKELLGKVIGVPGEFTTSWLLYRIFAPPYAEAKFYNFDEVGPAVKSGEVDAGILLHEGQILYEQQGFHGVLDLGKRWYEKTGLPIPLGLDLVNRNLGDELSQKVADALKASIVYAHAHEDDALDYALGFGRGIDREDGRKFVRMYVNEDTVDLGEEGVEALETLFRMAAQRGIIEEAPDVELVQAK
ncbi:MAG: ABC transporter substrate-binding protein [Chloroflexi bacterium]|nr:ABC transporter substrate-binding protein [Chloroflexota bacterium]